MTGNTLRRYLNADLAFHLLLLKAAENRRALTIFADVNLRSAIFGCHSHERDLHHVAWVWLHHARVARSIRQRDPVAAQRWLESHMQQSMEAALHAHDARRTRDPRNPAGKARAKGKPNTSDAGKPEPELTEAMTALITALRSPGQ